jgi:hypothetical protein
LTRSTNLNGPVPIDAALALAFHGFPCRPDEEFEDGWARQVRRQHDRVLVRRLDRLNQLLGFRIVGIWSLASRARSAE